MSTSDSLQDAAIRSSLEKSTLQNANSIANRLQPWLNQRDLGEIAAVRTPGTSGASSEIYVVELARGPICKRCVLRLISARVAYPYVDAGQQYLSQKILAQGSAAPVPEPIAFEPDERILGAPFILMDYVEGKGAPDWPSYVKQGWIHDLDAEQRSRLWENGLNAIAQIHSADIVHCDPASLALRTGGLTALDRLVAYWRLYLDVVQQEGVYPVLEQAVSWLETAQPEMNDDPVMVWGDASLRNMLFRGLDPVAVLDLEFSHLGVAGFDVAFYVMMDRVMAEAYAQTDRLAGFWDEEQTFDHYEKLTGRRVDHRLYFCRMAVTYMALANTRVYQRLAREGKMPQSQIAQNPPLIHLRDMFA
ncbi:hypothetical protein MB02_11865 [Croceicoccus estronivorus]|uniref:phosphotransferase family protein n=1 Tax=Croceicoccus estronivorus TaxID=1172626 RepID=UPI00082DE0F7|nr:phosphotransferase family protein [Croceicoccus estronivorus]OCC23324.1 hypothetical protein MB02_11865 [Croceicoccus estronivorus]